VKLDIDELLAALEKPVVVIGGEEYPINYPSFLDRLRIQKMYDEQDWADDEGQAETVTKIAEMCGLPADKILDLPEILLVEVMSFLLLTARGVDPTLPLTGPRENLESDQ